MSWHSRPSRGNNVWVARRHKDGLQANGEVWMIDYDGQEVTVRYYSSKSGVKFDPGFDIDTFDIGDFEGRLKGRTWMLDEA